MMTRLRAGSARAISRPRSRMSAVMPWIDSDRVPGAHSCSRARLIASVGSCQRSSASPQRVMMRRGKFPGQHDIGIERQVGTMLLDRTDRQANNRTLAENLRDVQVSEFADQS